MNYNKDNAIFMILILGTILLFIFAIYSFLSSLSRENDLGYSLSAGSLVIILFLAVAIWKRIPFDSRKDALFIILLLGVTFLSMIAIYLVSYRLTYNPHDDGHMVGLAGGISVIIVSLIVVMCVINPFNRNIKKSDKTEPKQ